VGGKKVVLVKEQEDVHKIPRRRTKGYEISNIGTWWPETQESKKGYMRGD